VRPALLLSALALLAGCARPPHHPGWVIRFSIEVVGPQPAGGYRLLFPYIVGDLYGSPTTGDFVRPMSGSGGALVLDLNRTSGALERELGPTDFSLGFLKISPPEARIARLAPLALERHGIDPVGSAEWRDARSRDTLMLIYFDRPARITGGIARNGATLRYDITAPKAGYVWVAARETAPREMLFTSVPRPPRLLLIIRTAPRAASAQDAHR
jgi:hypothetical protein